MAVVTPGRFQRVLGLFKVRESGNVEYWISQAVILVSTVLGVYLAARAGYSTAIQFEVARGEREGYYLRRALIDEVKSNLSSVDEWSGNFEKALREKVDPVYFEPTDNWVVFFNDKMGWAHLGELTHPDERRRVSSFEQRKALRLKNELLPEDLKMKTFVWDTMKQQVITFQLPPELLSAVRSYYDTMEGNVKDARSNTERAGPAAVAILKETRRMREEVVSVAEKEMAQVRASLASKGVPVQ
jgi:hypothetical protein